MLSKANKLHGYHTYNKGVHSCSGTSIWLYDGPHMFCAFVLKYYLILRAGSDLSEYGPRRRRRSPRDSHESTMGLRCSWRTRTGATPSDGTDDYATAGSGLTCQSGALDSESIPSQLVATCAGY